MMTHTAAMSLTQVFLAPQTRPLARIGIIVNSTDIKVLSIYSVLHFVDILASTARGPDTYFFSQLGWPSAAGCMSFFEL